MYSSPCQSKLINYIPTILLCQCFIYDHRKILPFSYSNHGVEQRQCLCLNQPLRPCYNDRMTIRSTKRHSKAYINNAMYNAITVQLTRISIAQSVKNSNHPDTHLRLNCRFHIQFLFIHILQANVAMRQMAASPLSFFTGGIKQTLHPVLWAYSTVFFVPPSIPSKQASRISACVTR